MAMVIKPFPILKGEDAKSFLDEIKRVDAGISEKEKKNVQDEIWDALRFLGGKDFPDTTPPK